MSPAMPCPKTSPVSFGKSSLTNEFSIIASNWVFALPSFSGPPAASASRERASAPPVGDPGAAFAAAAA
jgi:hypothetical protein